MSRWLIHKVSTKRQIMQGRPSGNGFVEMETEDDVKAAMALDREKIGRRYIEEQSVMDNCIRK